jgi:hypothetical protein
VGVAYYAFAALSHIRTEDGYYLVSYASIALLAVWAAERLGLRRMDGVSALAALSVLVGANFLVRVALTYDLSHAPARNAPEVATIDALTQPGDRIFVGPYDPYVYLASDRMPATTSPFFFPWQAIDPRSESRLLDELRSARPPVILFHGAEAVNDRWMASEYAAPLLDALGQDYVAVDPTSPLLGDILVPRERAVQARQRLAQGLVASDR